MAWCMCRCTGRTGRVRGLCRRWRDGLASLWNNAAVRAVDSLDDGREYQFDLVR